MKAANILETIGRTMILVDRSQFSAAESGPETVLLRPEFERFLTVKAAWFGAMIGVARGNTAMSDRTASPPATRETMR